MIRARLRAALRDDGAIAMVEFCLILPFVLLLGYGGLETANYVLTYMKVSQIAMTVADNAGRVRQALDETDVNQLMVGARVMGRGLNFGTNGRVILSDLEMRTTDNPVGSHQWIRWQRCSGALQQSSSYGGPLDSNGNAITNLSNTANTDHGAVETKSTILGMGPISAYPISSPNYVPQIVASAGTAVMFVEVYYTYQPLVPGTFLLGKLNLLNNLTMHTTEAFNIRQRTDFSVYNSQSLSDPNRADCTKFSATTPYGNGN
ncbi:MAG TPA: TadE/TadG family type IV pilus assembly protein [Sphingomonas sp.]